MGGNSPETCETQVTDLTGRERKVRGRERGTVRPGSVGSNYSEDEENDLGVP